MEVKKPTTYDEQLAILEQRGIILDNREFCKEKLNEIGYYRFTGYALPFKNSDSNTYSNVTFKRIYYIYQFDSNLRAIFFSCIEDIEIYLRSNLSYYFTDKYGSLGYTDPANFKEVHDHEKFKKKYDGEIENNKTVAFVKHHIDQYDGQFPLWVLMELFTFGMLSYFYADLKPEDRKTLAFQLYDTTEKKLSNWLICCTDLRNICSHYGRLYYRMFSAVPKVDGSYQQRIRLWGYLNVLKNLYPHKQKWNDVVVPRIIRIFDLFSGDIDLFHIAFPDNWKELIIK